MCPVEALDTLIDEGAGFAGAALGGFGQGPNSPDMMARSILLPIHHYTGSRESLDLSGSLMSKVSPITYSSETKFKANAQPGHGKARLHLECWS